MIKIRKWAGSSPAAQQAAQLYELLEQVYGVSPWTLDQLVADLTANTYYVAEQEGQLLGFLALQENDFEAEVLQIAVLPAYQGQGLARALFAQLPTDREIFLEVRESNQPAYSFYLKAGFEVLGRRKDYYHAPVEDAIIMKRDRNEG